MLKPQKPNNNLATLIILKELGHGIDRVSHVISYMSMSGTRHLTFRDVDLFSISIPAVVERLGTIVEFIDRYEAFERETEKDVMVLDEIVSNLVDFIFKQSSGSGFNFFKASKLPNGNINVHEVVDTKDMDLLLARLLRIECFVDNVTNPFKHLVNKYSSDLISTTIVLLSNALMVAQGNHTTENPYDILQIEASGLFDENDARFFCKGADSVFLFERHNTQQSFTKEEIEQARREKERLLEFERREKELAEQQRAYEEASAKIKEIYIPSISIDNMTWDIGFDLDSEWSSYAAGFVKVFDSKDKFEKLFTEVIYSAIYAGVPSNIPLDIPENSGISFADIANVGKMLSCFVLTSNDVKYAVEAKCVDSDNMVIDQPEEWEFYGAAKIIVSSHSVDKETPECE